MKMLEAKLMYAILILQSLLQNLIIMEIYQFIKKVYCKTKNYIKMLNYSLRMKCFLNM